LAPDGETPGIEKHFFKTADLSIRISPKLKEAAGKASAADLPAPKP
jgi:hypothetical protein